MLMPTEYVSACATKANRSLWISLCVLYVRVCDRLSLVMLGLITSENHLACAESAYYKSTKFSPSELILFW